MQISSFAPALAAALLLAACSSSSHPSLSSGIYADSGVGNGGQDSGDGNGDGVDTGAAPDTGAASTDSSAPEPDAGEPTDATTAPPEDAPPADTGTTQAQDSGSQDTGTQEDTAPATGTWAYLYPTYFAGTSMSQTQGHCSSSCHQHKEANSASDSSQVQAAYNGSGHGLSLFGGGMPADNTGSMDPTAAADVTAWANANFP